ncbi:hypothetical protein CRE_21998 [Caenorhabditis remanei]|uniref:Integrase catalytic domain-containing protein n=1 Tax=Caenorhabditis remanei TaxID=31234 RepID=E3N3K0_CAERE|nr:hypothetical protein CRE_21998 [Caenorhabditis remanei]
MSGTFRSQIGLCRSRLAAIVEEANNVDADVTSSSAEEVFADLLAVVDISDRLRTETTRLESYIKQWDTLISTDPTEKATQDDFKTRTGDYTKDLTLAKAALITMEKCYSEFIVVHKKKCLKPTVYPPFVSVHTTPSPAPPVTQQPPIFHTPPITIHVPHTSSGTPTVIDANLSIPSIPQQQSVTHPSAVTPSVTNIPSTISESPGQSIPPMSLVPSNVQQLPVQPMSSIFPVSAQLQPVSSHSQPVPQGYALPVPPQVQPVSSNSQPVPQGYALPVPTVQSSQPFSIQLPSINLPKFTGDAISYRPFIELFSSLVDTHNVNDICRFHYLQSSLQGDAQRLIQHLPLSASSYSAARRILNDCYGDDTRVKHLLVRNLQNLPSVAHSTDPSRILDFWSDACSLFYRLQSIDASCDNAVTADIIMQKLPKSYICSMYTGSNKHRVYIASEFLHVLNGFIRENSLVDTIYNDNHSTEKRVTTMSVQQTQRGASPHRSARYNDTRDSSRSNTFVPNTPCAFCSDNSNFHRHSECPSTKQLRDGRKSLKTRNSAFNASRPDIDSLPASPSSHNHHRHSNSRSPTPRRQPDSRSASNRAPSPRGDNSRDQPRRVQFANTNSVTSAEGYQTTDHSAVSFTTFSQPLPTPLPPLDSSTLPSDVDVVAVFPKIEGTRRPIAMMTSQMWVDNKDGVPIQVNVFFDGGSDRSWICNSVCEQLLGLEALDEQQLLVQSFGGSAATAVDSKIYEVVFNVKEEKVPIVLSSINEIATSLTSGRLDEPTIRRLLHDAHADLPRSTDKPGILIGLDYMSILLGDTSSKRLPNGTTLHWTDCGIMVTGTEKEFPTAEQTLVSSSSFAQEPYYSSTVQTTPSPAGILDFDPEAEHSALREVIQKFWNLDSVGIFDHPKTTDEELAAKFFAQTTTRDADGRYVCRWPYKDPFLLNIPDNRALAYHRLQSTLRRLRKDPTLYAQYGEIIRDQLRRGFIEVVPDEHQSDGRVHYLSHHPVVKQSSQTTKVRIVYDASARSHRGGQSLNDLLHTGESLLPQLHGILMRCRLPQILISGDIEKAFLMLGLHKLDRDVTRFLWQPPDEHESICYRFCRVPFGIKTSPYLLNAAIHFHLTSIGQPLSQSILKNTYVDNMNLTQFFSNSSTLDKQLAVLEQKPFADIHRQKLLGVLWNTNTDHLAVPIPPRLRQPPTKRKILQHVASTYDPVGFVAPVVLKGKLFFQKLWTHSTDWDASLTDDENEEWNLIENAICGDPITVHRKYFSTPTTLEHKFELHVFGDASDLAYGAVAYLRRVGPSTVDVAFLSAKVRVSPLRKALTIPQAELLALERCAQLSKTLHQELNLPIQSIVIWSDSMCSLDQIAANRAPTVYGRNRLRTINQLAPHAIFSHVPGKQNPADVLSRGCSLEELRHHPLWWTGPSFLKSRDVPIRTSSVVPTVTSMAVTAVIEPLNLDSRRFSTFGRMFNVVCLLVSLFSKDNGAAVVKSKATAAIIKLAQSLNPPDESTIQNLKLVSDNGIWFYQGRIPERRVYFLPPHHIATLFVQHIHRLHKHSSILYTLAKVRNEVWIPKGHSFVKKAVKDCHFCKVLHARPTYQPDFPILPSSRTQWYPPFTYCGMDYGGPIYAKNKEETRKYWFILFTCLTTRYTVVELVVSLSADALLGVLRRFCSQFGCPKEIRTDNAAQITMLSAVMEEAKHQSSTQHALPSFRFIPALSPWSGGMYERMVGLVKRCLVRSGSTRTLLSEEDLRTLLKEAEGVINARPLTYVNNSDINPLRPVDLVFPNKRHPTVLAIEETLDSSPLSSSHQALLENWMKTSSLIEHFIQRWNEEYVQVLQSRTQTEHRQDKLANTTPLAVGSVVMVESDGNKSNWPLARIESLGPRAAKLFVPRTGKVIERPFKKIYQLEGDVVPEPSTHSDAPHTSSGPITRSRSLSLSKGFPSNTLLTLMVMSLLLPATMAMDATVSSTGPTPSLVSLITMFSEVVVIGSIIALLTTGIHLLLTILKYSRQLFYCVRFMLSLFESLFRCICSSSCLKKRMNQPRILILSMFLLLPCRTLSCNDVAHIAAQERACYDHINVTRCHVNSVSLVNVRANGSTSCLEIQHENNAPLATLKITAEALVSYCEKRNLFYSRDFRLQHEYVKRCDSAGSCSIDMCSNIKPDEDLPELSPAAKRRPGFTNCAPGCGGWHCSCWYYDPACLFYRYFAEPTSNDIYELFHCPIWSTRLRLKVELGALKLTLDVAPGIKYSIVDSNISITAVGIHTPPLQAHSATFISAYGLGAKTARWTSFTFTPTSSPGAPAKGFAGELQCKDKQSAEDFNCVFDPTLCKCVGFATKVNCRCFHEKMTEYRKKHKLPTRGINHQVLMINNRVTTLTVQETMVSLQVEIENATLSRWTTFQTCNATQEGKIEGCFSCLEGGRVPISCISTKIVKAQMRCGVIEVAIECGPYGQSNLVVLGFNTKEVSLNCTIECGHSSYLFIQGELQALQAFTSNTTFYASPYQRMTENSIAIGRFLQDVATVVIEAMIPSMWFFMIVAFMCFSPFVVRRMLSRRVANQTRIRRQKYMQ